MQESVYYHPLMIKQASLSFFEFLQTQQHQTPLQIYSLPF